MSVSHLEERLKKVDWSGFRDGDLDIDMAYTLVFLEHFFVVRQDDRLGYLIIDLHRLNDIIRTAFAEKLKDPALGRPWPRADMTVENLYSARKKIEIYKHILQNTFRADGGRFDVRIKFGQLYRPLLAWINCYLKKMQKSHPEEYAAAVSKKRMLNESDDDGNKRSCNIPERVRGDDYGTFNGYHGRR